MNLWEGWETPMEDVHNVTETFLKANAYDPDYAVSQIPKTSRCQVSDLYNADSS